MKTVIQRVTRASVSVDGEMISNISHGFVVLLGVERTDNEETAKKLASRISRYRLFCDDDGKMNLNIQQVNGAALVVSQFTLVADTQNGNRPGFSRGASPEQGRILYHTFVDALRACAVPVKTGRFGANMQVELVNDGPVTFCIDS